MSAVRPIDDEISAVLLEPDKRVVGDLRWSDDEDLTGHELLAPVTCPGGELLVVRGQRCPAAGTLRFALVLRGVGRIAALDLRHHPAHAELQFHRWTPGRRDPCAPLPPGAHADDERSAWALFCRLTGIRHDGALLDPPLTQEALL